MNATIEGETIVSYSSGWLKIPPSSLKRKMIYYLRRGHKYYFRSRSATLVVETNGDDRMKALKYGTEVDIEMGGGGTSTTKRGSKKTIKSLQRARRYFTPSPSPHHPNT